MITISNEKGISTKSGSPKEYEFVCVKFNDVELTRFFLKPMEKEFFKQVLGNYEKVKDANLSDKHVL